MPLPFALPPRAIYLYIGGRTQEKNRPVIGSVLQSQMDLIQFLLIQTHVGGLRMKRAGIWAIVIAIFASMSVQAANTSAFTDVPANAYYAAAIEWAMANGITNGIGDNRFGVSQSVSRAQTVTFL